MKGVSEVVGTVLLVSLAVILAMGYFYFSGSLFSKQSGDAQKNFDDKIKCGYSDIDIITANWNNTAKTLYVVVENTGGVDLSNVNIQAGTSASVMGNISPGNSSNKTMSIPAKPSKVIVSSGSCAIDEQIPQDI